MHNLDFINVGFYCLYCVFAVFYLAKIYKEKRSFYLYNFCQLLAAFFLLVMLLSLRNHDVTFRAVTPFPGEYFFWILWGAVFLLYWVVEIYLIRKGAHSFQRWNHVLLAFATIGAIGVVIFGKFPEDIWASARYFFSPSAQVLLSMAYLASPLNYLLLRCARRYDGEVTLTPPGI